LNILNVKLSLNNNNIAIVYRVAFTLR